jgi:hypothetical protein
MSKIVAKLVKKLRSSDCCDAPMCDCDEEADGIEHLSKEVERLREALVTSAASLAAAISLLERGGKKAAPSDTMFAMMLADYQKALDNARAALTQEKTND